MNSKNSSTRAKLDQDRRQAKHADFFFADFIVSSQMTRKSPVFIIGDSDEQDVVVCKCTSHPARNEYDIKVELKKTTSVRTNKIYTISRDQLLFKIPQTANQEEYKKIMEMLAKALHM
ncbi:hypothetical protein J2W91_003530 [Paenibacillus amylolyticus]|uniref:Type II toxin-antitoxin system PemK/MazF family toxin n=1 Tax=Paenibacillus amylolyticus TaxID=1451 RepID=A0AAP5LS13_PAEAM|nr:type II toxin-antitoxin system PemK/MazF family toxin [Paenibacillus amylolyticus]MDR6725044.1 hypothetical protein [Paenibacillus amylolyticus]